MAPRRLPVKGFTGRAPAHASKKQPLRPLAGQAWGLFGHASKAPNPPCDTSAPLDQHGGRAAGVLNRRLPKEDTRQIHESTYRRRPGEVKQNSSSDVENLSHQDNLPENFSKQASKGKGFAPTKRPRQSASTSGLEVTDTAASASNIFCDVRLSVPSNCQLFGYLGRIKGELQQVVNQRTPLLCPEKLLDQPRREVAASPAATLPLETTDSSQHRVPRELPGCLSMEPPKKRLQTPFSHGISDLLELHGHQSSEDLAKIQKGAGRKGNVPEPLAIEDVHDKFTCTDAQFGIFRGVQRRSPERSPGRLPKRWDFTSDLNFLDSPS